jgi:hypothetical protein
VDAAEAALCRLAGDESERVARAAQAELQLWEAARGRPPGAAGQRKGTAKREPVRPGPKVVAGVSPVQAADAGTTVPVETPTPAPPAETPAGSGPTRRRLLVAGAALAVVLVVSGIAYAVYGGGGENPPAVPAPAVTPSPTVPADEQCTDEIMSNRRWVCLTSAVIANGKLTIKYKADYDGAEPNIDTGYHVHIYGSDGKNPPDYSMSSHYPKNHDRYFWEDEEPSVRDIDEPRVASAIGGFAKVCARVAIAGHGLALDKKGGYHTGNCAPITAR